VRPGVYRPFVYVHDGRPRWGKLASLLILSALIFGALFLITACKPQDDDFARKCAAKGGVVHTTHRNGSTSRVCKPAPQPRPQPGWQ
jgi:hypothetical protein